MASRSPSRKIDTVSSDEEQVRLNIYDGVIPLGEAGAELLKLALAQMHRSDAVARLTEMNFRRMEEILSRQMDAQREALTPWPVRWWRYLVSQRKDYAR